MQCVHGSVRIHKNDMCKAVVVQIMMAQKIFDEYDSVHHTDQENTDEDIMLEALEDIIDWRFDNQFRHAIANWLIKTTAKIFKDYDGEYEKIEGDVEEMLTTLREAIYPQWAATDYCCTGGITRKFCDMHLDKIIRSAFAKTSVGFDTRMYE